MAKDPQGQNNGPINSRRNFIKSSIASGAAIAAGVALASNIQAKGDKDSNDDTVSTKDIDNKQYLNTYYETLRR